MAYSGARTVGIIVSAWTNWPCMMGVQWHLRWLEHIVIPHFHLLDKSLQATNSSFIFILMSLAHQVDSNWYTMQQVRILVTLFLEQRKSWNFSKCDLWPILTCRTCNSRSQKPSATVRLPQYCFLGIKKMGNSIPCYTYYSLD